MANLTATVALISSSTSGHGRGYTTKEYELTFDANTDYPAGGVAIDLTKATNTNYIERAGWARNPTRFDVVSHPTGFVAVMVAGSDLTNWKMTLYGATGVHALALSDGTIALNGTKARFQLSGNAI